MESTNERHSSLGYFVEAIDAYRREQNSMLSDPSLSGSVHGSGFVGSPARGSGEVQGSEWTPPPSAEPSPKTAEQIRLMHGISGVFLLVFAMGLYWSRPSHPALKRLAGFCGMLGGAGGAVYAIRRRASYVDLADEASWKRFRDEATDCADFPRFVRRVCSHVVVTANGKEEPLKPCVFSQHRLFQHYPFYTPMPELERLAEKLAETVVSCDVTYAGCKKIIDDRARRERKDKGWAACWTVGQQWYQERMELLHTFQYVEQTLRQDFLDLRYRGLIQKPPFTDTVDPMESKE